MLESNFFPFSWDTDIYQDSSLDINLLESPFDEVDFLGDLERENQFNYDVSSNSSDMDGFNLVDLENNELFSDTFVSQILGDDSKLQNYFLEEDLSPLPSDCFKNAKSSLSNKKRSPYSQSLNSWSSMSADEKKNTLVSISETTCSLGIREQLDVIRILSPDAEISSDMKEFTLEMELLNDEKLKQIKDYYKRHSISFPKDISQDLHVESPKVSKNCKTLSKKACSVSRTSKKQRQKKGKVWTQAEELKKIKRKQARQGKKEEKSGLFVYEKIVKCSNLEEDEDVNILE